MSERSHVHPVFLPAELYVGVAKAQAQLEIGKSAAILLMIGEGLHTRGFIPLTVYECFKRKYERKLVEIVRRERAKPLTTEDLRKQQEIERWQKSFSVAIQQWPTMKEKAKDYYLKRAKQFEALPEAKSILSLNRNSNAESDVVRDNDSMKPMKTGE